MGPRRSPRRRDTCSLLIGQRRFYPVVAGGKSSRERERERERVDDEKEETRWQTDGACQG